MKTGALLLAAAGHSVPRSGALTFTAKGSASSGNEKFSTTGSMTPTPGSLLVVMVATRLDDETPVFTGTIGGTWVSAGTHARATNLSLFVYTCADYNTSGVLTTTFANNLSSEVAVFQIVGANLVTPIHQYKTAIGTTSTTPAAVLDVAPTVDCFGCFAGTNGFPFSAAGLAFTRLSHSEVLLTTGVEYDTDGDGEQTVDGTFSGNNAAFCVFAAELT